MRGFFAAALAAATLAAPGPGTAQDLAIVSTITTSRNTTRTQTQYISSSRLRLTDGERDTIVDLGSGKVTVLDPRRKQYSETSLAELRAFLDQIDAAMEGRAVFDRAIGPTAGVTVTRVEGGGRKIAGFDTEQYTLTLGDAVRYDVWTAPALKAPERYYDSRKILYATLGPLARRFDRLLDELKKIDGFPLASVSDSRVRVGRRKATVEATAVRREPIPDSVFTVPSDYTKVDSPFGPGQTPRPPRSPRPPS